MTDRTELLRLHARLCLDSRNPLQGFGHTNIRPTKAGRAWLSDYARYRQLHREINGTAMHGGPADLELAKAFGFIIGEDPNPEDEAA